MAKNNYPQLQHGDLPQITKLTKLLRLGPTGQGYTYQYVKECLNANNERHNEEILAIARDLVAARERSMAALLEVRAKKAAKKHRVSK